MKTNYKLYTLVGLLGLSFTACELKEDLTSVYNANNAYTTEENAQEGVNGIYRYLLGATHTSNFYINDMSTDDCFKDGIAFEIYNENGLSGNVELARCYNGNWQMIGCANTAIDNISMIPESRFKIADKKPELLAEAHFLRAFAFYQLTNAFYRVPLITNGFYEADANPTLATVEELDDQIEQDLLIATNNLPDEWGTATEGASGRPTKGAAYGYLMRLNMRKAGRLREEGKDATAAWQAALMYADQVITSGKYALQAKVFDVFDPSKPETLNNNEIIFAIRASDKVPSGSSDLALYFTPWEYDMGWNNINMPLELYWKFDSDDQRLKELIVTSFNNVYGKPIKYISPKLNEVGTLRNEKSNPQIVENDAIYTKKYKYTKPGTYNYNTPNNLILLRYADVLLCKAEILNELNGPTQESVDLINKIRERAFENSNHNYTLANFASKEDMRSKLCDERLFELNMEGVRRVDLIRMGLWKDRLDAYMDLVKQKLETKEANLNARRDPNVVKNPYDLSPEWKVYPKFSNPFKPYDKRRYYPIPGVYSNKFPDLQNNRSFREQ